MAHQIVATSVPRGLDGVSGYQTVLKSAGIPPRVFDRLKARSGYSHRYPHGDGRNPVVYLHRIEELGGNRWHVLGCIRDAGSDHTGRSNFLAHMLAIDTTEARGKLGGPASAAMTRGCFLDKWDSLPDGAAPSKTLVAADRPPQPGDMSSWTQAGLDPGLAGDLAAAAMGGRKAVIVTRPGDDVLALFADALRLVEPSKRWAVTFNTCAIEDFDGIWKAVRADLADARDVRDGKAVVIDLTANPSGSAEPYARFARGELELLPWQKGAEPVEQRPREDDAAAENRPPRVSGAIGKGQPSEGPKKQGTTKGSHGRARRPRYREEEATSSPWRWVGLASVGLLFIAVLAAIPFRERLFGLAGSAVQKPLEPAQDLPAEPVKPPAIDPKDTAEYRHLQQVEDARKRLAAGVDGKTVETLRGEAKKLQQRISTLRSNEGFRIMPADTAARDPLLGVSYVIDDCEEISQVLETTSLKLEHFASAQEKLSKAFDELASLKKQVDDLQVTERSERDKANMAANANARKKRQQQAFQSLQLLVKAVSLPTASEAAGIDDGPRPAAGGLAGKLDLGPFAVDDLVEPKFRLALPRDEIKDSAYKAEIVKSEAGGNPKWEIRYLPPGEALDGEKSVIKPRALAFLVARDGHLVLEVPRTNELGLSPFALLRRSVLLVEAKDPAAPAAAGIVHEIRLVQPTTIRPLVIDFFGEHRKEMKITAPKGISRPRGGPQKGGTLELPISSLRFEAEFPQGEKINLELPRDVQEGTDPGFGKWERPLAQLGQDLSIQAIIELSLPQATMAVKTEFTGAKASQISIDIVKRNFIDQPDESFKRLKRSFDNRVKEGKGFGFAEKKQSVRKINDWFSRELVGKNAGVHMPDHDTTKKSFDVFLQEQYNSAPEGRRTGIPKNYDAFFQRCQSVTDAKEWDEVFTSRVAAWGDWFWPQFEDRWRENVKLFQGALVENHEIRIKSITSLAYDDAGKVYEVPLVVPEEPAAAKNPQDAAAHKSSTKAVGLD